MTKTPFDFLNSISYTKEDLNDHIEDYNAFMINKGLSMYGDTILFANEMNLYHQLPPKVQYLYLISSIVKKKRYGKWPKADKNEDVDLISTYYNINRRKALDYLKFLTEQQKEEIKSQMVTGGKE